MTKKSQIVQKNATIGKNENHTFGNKFTSQVIPQMNSNWNGGDGNSEAVV